MITIKDAEINNITEIHDIAYNTWPTTYGSIITSEQIDYMLDMMYSKKALIEQMTKLKHHFILIKRNKSETYEGFVSFEFDYKNSYSTKLHKLYVLPQSQGHGFGQILIEEVCKRAKEYGNKSVLLNMNRNNKALNFYKKLGFEIIKEEDIDIGNGFLMEDYVFEKLV